MTEFWSVGVMGQPQPKSFGHKKAQKNTRKDRNPPPHVGGYPPESTVSRRRLPAGGRARSGVRDGQARCLSHFAAATRRSPPPHVGGYGCGHRFEGAFSGCQCEIYETNGIGDGS